MFSNLDLPVTGTFLRAHKVQKDVNCISLNLIFILTLSGIAWLMKIDPENLSLNYFFLANMFLKQKQPDHLCYDLGSSY